MLMALTINSPSPRSKAPPPQFTPPPLKGKMIVPAHARRRVEPVGAQSFDLPPAQESIDEGETPGIVGAEALRNQGRRSRGDRLRRGSLLARSVACRRRAFHDR